ncbi:polygalacturonase inhibitor 1-like [Typha latifolia]|uniref:polygalacturonase inhibitor 1-like n=1 Tax=Typha latifolia TaxID=4733 RepID=UPI003C2C02F0
MATSTITILFLLFQLCTTSLILVSSARCNKDDKKALLAIKSSFHNAYHFSSWDPSTPCCDWYGVECDPATGRVTALSVFQDTNVTGPIPSSVASLPYLRELFFHHLPNLVGPIPSSISNLTHLEYLTISWTGLSGSIPSFLGSLTSLTQLDLSFNSLSGSIPPSFSQLRNLISIDISRNHLTGSLPTTLFQLLPPSSQPAYLRLSHNNLSGEIPKSYADVGFAQVDLSRNRFTGDGSVFFGRSKPVQQIDLSRNLLEFDLSKVEFPKKELMQVDLSHNLIRGRIPDGIIHVWNLQFFNMSYNRLCGEIPSGGQMGRFDEYCYQHNKCLCGTPLPPCK